MSGKVSILVLTIAFAVSAFLIGKTATISVLATSEDKIDLCHKTHSTENPWVVQEVNANEKQSHLDNGDFLYQGPTKENGKPDNEDGAADNWCNEHSSNSHPTCLGNIPSDSNLLVNITEGVTNDVDSGLHGNWAIDNYSRTIKVWRLETEGRIYCADVRYNGTFDVQPEVLSPQNGNPLTGNEDGTMTGGRRAKITGSFLSSPLWVTNGDVGSYNYGCTINSVQGECSGNFSWVNKYFGSEFNYEDLNWGWTYTSCGHGQWINASTGNSGDIVVGPTNEVCQTTPPPPSETNNGSNDNSNGGLSNPTAPSCNAAKPATPTILSAVRTGNSEKLTWSAVANATYYSIVYGSAPGYQYGVANTGNVTTYTINDLNPQTTYHFAVNAVNDCMPGDAGTFNGGTGGQTGQVLGASTMAGTGTFEESLYSIIMGLGGISTIFGIGSFKKAFKKA